MKTISTPLALLVVALVAGCDSAPTPQSMPDVNEANCQTEKIMQLPDKATREAFASQCSRRPIGIAQTEKPKNWLELTDPKR